MKSNAPGSGRTKNLLLFVLLLIPLCLFLWIVGRQFQADRSIRRARAAGENLRAAAEWMERALRAIPGDADAWNNLGNIHLRMAQATTATPPEKRTSLEQAEACYRKSIDRVPINSLSHINLGWARYQIDQLEGHPPGPYVRHSFELAARLDPFGYYPHMLLADYFLYEGERETAFREYRKAIEAYPHNRVISAVLDKALGQTTDYDRILEVVPEDEALAHWYLAALLLEKLGRWEQSRSEFLKVVELEPRNTYYRDGYLRTCMRMRDADAALREVKEREQLLGPDPEVLLLLADFLKKQGRYDEALAVCERVATIAPGLPRTTTLTAEIKAGQGNLVEAVRTYEAHLEAHPDDPEGYFQLGRIYQQHGNKYRAAELFSQAAYRAPDQVRFQAGLARAYLQLGMRERALEALDRSRKLDPDEIQFDLLAGTVYLEKEDWMEAARAYGRALKKAPNHPEALKGFLSAQSRIPRDDTP
jgi:tetratricopeptide (TPR) repeat protein